MGEEALLRVHGHRIMVLIPIIWERDNRAERLFHDEEIESVAKPLRHVYEQYPIQDSGKADDAVKIGLSTYSLLNALKSGEMTVLDAIAWIAENGGEHMEIVPYGFTLVDNPELAGGREGRREGSRHRAVQLFHAGEFRAAGRSRLQCGDRPRQIACRSCPQARHDAYAT